MNLNRKLVAAALPLLVAVIWTIAKLGWLGVVLAAAVGAIGWIAYRWAVQRQPAEDNSHTSLLTTSGLPTADETVFLELSATVHWNAVKPETYHGDLARELVLRQAREVTSRWRPIQYSLAQHELAARIGRPEAETPGELEVWATDVLLTLPEAVQQHLAKLDEAHRDGLLWEVSAVNETRIRTYLREDALRTPASAVVWWLSQHEGSVERAVELADVLTRLSRLATGEPAADGAVDLESLIEAIENLAEQARKPAAHSLAEAFEQTGLTDLATALRDKYKLPTLRPIVDHPPDSEPPEPSRETPASAERWPAPAPQTAAAANGRASVEGPPTSDGARTEG
ncbi:hypothetical protein HPO96_25670 [Kribbella sandramycini]|uniref:Uncharacterized protein n=1 Tax=Kribbella sandramycini TaxID=60450 RepID=A0A7Y4P315_9ACTN|nr:hypothetical protein [Kribbella sandramycini]MBB6570494.1 hypothetical protein [Kribbella sandramycini]NOL43640.1 hypothetical protein [Kribbella sandramycini]